MTSLLFHRAKKCPHKVEIIYISITFDITTDSAIEHHFREALVQSNLEIRLGQISRIVLDHIADLQRTSPGISFTLELHFHNQVLYQNTVESVESFINNCIALQDDHTIITTPQTEEILSEARRQFAPSFI